MNSAQPFNLLLVEDNEDDVFLTQHAFEKYAAPITLHVVVDGLHAIAFLRQQPPYEQAPRPDLILLDLNMPRMNGHELLVALKQDEDLRTIPAIVLSTSAFEKDVKQAYWEHASAYITKPLYGFEKSARTKCFLDFWLNDLAKLPSRSDDW